MTENIQAMRILILSDESLVPLLNKHLAGLNPVPLRPRNLADALEQTKMADLAIVTYHFSEGGLQTCRRLNEADELLPVVVLSNSHSSADMQACFRAGAFDYLTMPPERQTFYDSMVAAYEKRKAQLARVEAMRGMPGRIAGLEGRLQEINEGLLELVLWQLKMKSARLEAHSLFLRRWSDRFLTFLKKDEETLQVFRQAATVHDLGYILLKDEVLPRGPVSAQEMFLWKRHPVEARHHIKKLIHDERVLELVEHHHEMFDGSGFPDGLTGKRLSEPVKLFSFLNGFAAKACPVGGTGEDNIEDAVLDVMNNAGRLYDPDIVNAFARFVSEVDVSKI